MCICITDNVPIRHNWKISYIKIYGWSAVGGRICTGLPMQHLALYIYTHIYKYIYMYIYIQALPFEKPWRAKKNRPPQNAQESYWRAKNRPPKMAQESY